MDIEPEKLSVEELEQVAGGTAEQTADERYDSVIADAWAALGVTAVIHSGNFFYGGSDNEYYIGIKKVTQLDARHHAMKIVGKQMKYNEWHY